MLRVLTGWIALTVLPCFVALILSNRANGAQIPTLHTLRRDAREIRGLLVHETNTYLSEWQEEKPSDVLVRVAEFILAPGLTLRNGIHVLVYLALGNNEPDTQQDDLTLENYVVEANAVTDIAARFVSLAVAVILASGGMPSSFAAPAALTLPLQAYLGLNALVLAADPIAFCVVQAHKLISKQYVTHT